MSLLFRELLIAHSSSEKRISHFTFSHLTKFVLTKTLHSIFLHQTGVFLFFRQEEETRSKDYNQCKVGLLSVLVAGAIGLPVVLSLPYNPNRSFAVGGAVFILEVIFLITWVKALKVLCDRKSSLGVQ